MSSDIELKSCDLLEDIAVVTTVQRQTLDKLVTKAEWCICNEIEQQKVQNNNIIHFDIGLGILSIKVVDDQVEYRFIPHKSLEKNIINTIIDCKNPLIGHLEASLAKKITKIYKELS